MNMIIILKEKENDTDFLNDVEQIYYFKYLYLKTYSKKIEQNSGMKNNVMSFEKTLDNIEKSDILIDNKGDKKMNMLEYTFEYVSTKEDSRFIDKDEIKQKYYNWLGNIDDDIDCFGDFLREYLQIDDLEICDDNITEIYYEIKDML